MMKTKPSGGLLALLLFAGLLAASGCTGKSEEPPKDHVFKGYQDALEKAKQVQPQLDAAEAQRRKQLDQ